MSTMALAGMKPQPATAPPSSVPARPVLAGHRCACGGIAGPAGECAACKAKRQAAEAKPGSQPRRGGHAASPRDVLETPGQPLDPAARAWFEPRLGHNLGNIRIHADSEAATSARSVNAMAYTAGRHIVFDTGKYAPQTTDGRSVLAHELVHAVQQRAADASLPATLPMTSPGEASEQEASTVAAQLVRGEPATPAVHQTPRIARQAPAPAPAPPAACATPVNWVHGTATDTGANAIRIPISWESSTGSLADLSNCTVREVVNYDPIPNPPFLWNPPNPTILTVPGTAGAGVDTHSYPPGLRTGITDPRVEGTMTANQVYQWRCTGPGCSSTWTNFPGEAYRITRQVVFQFAWLNPDRYIITKTGGPAARPFDYSRNVEIPPP